MCVSSVERGWISRRGSTRETLTFSPPSPSNCLCLFLSVPSRSSLLRLVACIARVVRVGKLYIACVWCLVLVCPPRVRRLALREEVILHNTVAVVGRGSARGGLCVRAVRACVRATRHAEREYRPSVREYTRHDDDGDDGDCDDDNNVGLVEWCLHGQVVAATVVPRRVSSTRRPRALRSRLLSPSRVS